ISPELYELERTAVFGRTWLNIGRVAQIPHIGSCFTKDIAVVGASVLVVRDADGEVRAFHDTGRHGSCTLDSPREEVRCEIWEGFVFVNFDSATTTPLRDYLGRFAHGLEGYPFGAMTEVYQFRSVVNSNWKLYVDAFAEFYHAPVLHAKQYVGSES